MQHNPDEIGQQWRPPGGLYRARQYASSFFCPPSRSKPQIFVNFLKMPLHFQIFCWLRPRPPPPPTAAVTCVATLVMLLMRLLAACAPVAQAIALNDAIAFVFGRVGDSTSVCESFTSAGAAGRRRPRLRPVTGHRVNGCRCCSLNLLYRLPTLNYAELGIGFGGQPSPIVAAAENLRGALPNPRNSAKLPTLQLCGKDDYEGADEQQLTAIAQHLAKNQRRT
eukprot:354547-Chlamydomonas_euryale.AAC.5